MKCFNYKGWDFCFYRKQDLTSIWYVDDDRNVEKIPNVTVDMSLGEIIHLIEEWIIIKTEADQIFDDLPKLTPWTTPKVEPKEHING